MTFARATSRILSCHVWSYGPIRGRWDQVTRPAVMRTVKSRQYLIYCRLPVGPYPGRLTLTTLLAIHSRFLWLRLLYRQVTIFPTWIVPVRDKHVAICAHSSVIEMDSTAADRRNGRVP